MESLHLKVLMLIEKNRKKILLWRRQGINGTWHNLEFVPMANCYWSVITCSQHCILRTIFNPFWTNSISSIHYYCYTHTHTHHRYPVVGKRCKRQEKYSVLYETKSQQWVVLTKLASQKQNKPENMCTAFIYNPTTTQTRHTHPHTHQLALHPPFPFSFYTIDFLHDVLQSRQKTTRI